MHLDAMERLGRQGIRFAPAMSPAAFFTGTHFSWALTVWLAHSVWVRSTGTLRRPGLAFFPCLDPREHSFEGRPESQLTMPGQKGFDAEQPS